MRIHIHKTNFRIAFLVDKRKNIFLWLNRKIFIDHTSSQNSILPAYNKTGNIYMIE